MGIPYSRLYGTTTIPKDVSTMNTRGFVRAHHPQLPPELIFSILSYLGVRATLQKAFWSLTHTNTLRLPRFHHSVWEEPPPETLLSGSRFPLTSTALVCKAWYRACIRLLYNHVFLATTRELVLFHRTITESPDLALLVKHVSIVIPRRKLRLPRIGGASRFRYQAASNIQGKIIYESAVSVLRACSPVASFTVRLPWSLDWDKLLLLIFPTHLRALTISGHDFPYTRGLRDTTALSHLEALFLTSVSLCATHSLPTLPKLRTLQIHLSNVSLQGVWSSQANRDIQQRFPGLQSVFFYENRVDQKHLRVFELLVASARIRCLYLIGASEMKAFEASLSAKDVPSTFKSVLSTVEHLTLGEIGESMRRWTAPRTLETLTLIFRRRWNFEYFGYLVDFLRFNEKRILDGTTPLRKVTVYLATHSTYSPSGAAATCYYGDLGVLKPICEKLRISLEMTDIQLRGWAMLESEGIVARDHLSLASGRA